eukprot:4143075-Amphidinium_carterae.1
MDQRVEQLEGALQAMNQTMTDFMAQLQQQQQQQHLLNNNLLCNLLISQGPGNTGGSAGDSSRPFDIRSAKQPPTFKGKPEEWKGFSFRFKRYISALDE